MFRKIYDSCIEFIFILLFVYLIYLLLRYPVQALGYAKTGLFLWFERMIPTLLPFMILSGIMVRMNLTERFASFFHPLFHRLFGISANGSYVLFMGMLCGFPMGARVIGELLESEKMSEEEGAYLLSFCNNIGPIYFISFVMSTLSISENMIPPLIMYGVPLIYGFILRHISLFAKQAVFGSSISKTFVYKQPTSELYAVEMQTTAAINHSPVSLPEATHDAIMSGLKSIAALGGYMVFFNLLNIMFLPLTSLPDSFLSLCSCLLEITSGISRTGKNGFYMILILLPFGGLSCLAQTYSMIRHTNLSISKYTFHKIMQTCLTAVIYAAYVFFASYSAP